MPALPSALAEKIATLSAASKSWQEMADTDRLAVIRQCRGQLATLDMDWVPDNMRCIGIEPSFPDEGKNLGFDPFLFLATVSGRFDKLAEALEGKLAVGEASGIKLDRQLPSDGLSIYDMGLAGQSAPLVKMELWADPNGAETEVSSAETAGVGVVLGAGNQNFLTAVDVIEMVFLQKKCVLLKHHPLRHFMAAPFKHIFAPLAEIGAYAQCVDADVQGAYNELVCHQSVVHVHMTGSGATHDRVNAALEKGGRQKQVLFTSELGCITPWIVCPGTTAEGVWPETSITDHAQMLSAAFKSSCSMNCLSPKVLVLPSEAVWPQRKAFLDALKTALATMPQPPPYYPGAHDRYAKFKAEYADSEEIEAPPLQPSNHALQKSQYEQLGQKLTPLPSLLCDVGTIGEKECRNYAIKNEAFSPVLAIATVACESREAYPMAAARAVNEHVFGTLSCNVIYPDPKDEALDKVLNALNYGCISVNHWAALLYSNPLGVWGAAPGAYKTSDPGSGLGFVGNAAHIQNPRKAVGYGPFVNKGVVMAGAMPYILADVLSIVIAGKSMAGMRVMGLLFRRMFGLLKPMPGASCGGFGSGVPAGQPPSGQTALTSTS